MLPTRENIRVALELYRMLQNWKLVDETIKRYVDEHKENKELPIIMTKVVLINSLYYAGVFWPLEMAKHIKNLADEKGLDNLISKGDPEAVELILNLNISGRKRKFLSFASKYCHFHNPDAYSMFDRYVYNLLKKINGKQEVLNVSNSNLKEYAYFHKAILNLIEKANLKEYSLDEMDKYLWLRGQKDAEDWSKLNREVKECFENNNNKDLVSKL